MRVTGRCALVASQAFLEAGDILITQGKQIAAHMLEASAVDIEFTQGRFVIAGTDRGIGIRTEDDVLITADGHRVLTDGLARSADEIEAFMRG